jgi:hypothetical protein
MEVSEHLVGSAAFKAVGTGDPRPAGSIPVHLRQSVSWRSPMCAESALNWGYVKSCSSAFGHVRGALLPRYRRALVSLRVAGCGRAWIDGSFVTSKRHPGDIDACYDPIGVDRSRLHPALLDLAPG